MEKRRIGVALLMLGLVACGGTAEAGNKAPETRVETVTDWTHKGQGHREIKVNGRSCIEFINYNGAGLSCDWSAK